MPNCKTCGKKSHNEYCFQHKPRKPIGGKAKKTLKQTKPLKKVSDKRKAQEAVYSTLRKTFMEQNPNCEICGGIAEQIHHRWHREGERLNDTRYWMAVCAADHREIHANPTYSYEMGYLIKG